MPNMAQLLVRNVPEEILAAIKARAARNNRSVEAEHRAILAEAVAKTFTREEKDAFFERARMLREETVGRTFTPSEVILRELRDEV